MVIKSRGFVICRTKVSPRIEIHSEGGGKRFSLPMIKSPVFFYKFIYFIYLFFWLRWVFVAACGLSLVVESGGFSSLWCAGFSLQWLLLLQSLGSRHAGFSSCGTRAQ